VRLAIVERSARARRPEAERERPGRGVGGQGRKRFCGEVRGDVGFGDGEGEGWEEGLGGYL